MAAGYDPDAYYQLQSGRVVEVVGELDGYLTLKEAVGDQVFDAERKAFIEGLDGGYIQPVKLQFVPVAE